jgi:hypothetical protein
MQIEEKGMSGVSRYRRRGRLVLTGCAAVAASIILLGVLATAPVANARSHCRAAGHVIHDRYHVKCRTARHVLTLFARRDPLPRHWKCSQPAQACVRHNPPAYFKWSL